MSFKVNDRIDVKLEFAPGVDQKDPLAITDWKEFPGHNGNLINLVHISAAAQMRLPVMKLVLTDNLRFFDWLKTTLGTGIADGAHVKITINQEPDSVVRYFRVYSWNRASAGDFGYTYSFECYWDDVKYWLQALKVGIRGTSSAVLQQIATSFCKLTWYANNETTSDDQVWLPANQPMSIFARSIAQHGFKSTTSHMIFGVDSVGAMRYLNLNKETSESSLKKAVSLQALAEGLPSGVTGTFVAQEFVPKTRSGINNTLGGYAYTLVEQFFPVPVAKKAYSGPLLSAFTGVMDSTELTRNEDIPIKIEERSIIDFSPIGVGNSTTGNIHTNYETGRAQNYLFNLLNSTAAEFAFHRITSWELGDRFFYKPPLSEYGDKTLDSEFEGEFSVVSKTIFITGSSYIEKVVACRNGLGRKA